jgi:hypothetical protein
MHGDQEVLRVAEADLDRRCCNAALKVYATVLGTSASTSAEERLEKTAAVIKTALIETL